MTEAQVIKRIKARIAEAGSLRQAARDWNVSASYLSEIVTGKKPPGEALLLLLGIRRIVTTKYTEVQS